MPVSPPKTIKLDDLHKPKIAPDILKDLWNLDDKAILEILASDTLFSYETIIKIADFKEHAKKINTFFATYYHMIFELLHKRGRSNIEVKLLPSIYSVLPEFTMKCVQDNPEPAANVLEILKFIRKNEDDKYLLYRREVLKKFDNFFAEHICSDSGCFDENIKQLVLLLITKHSSDNNNSNDQYYSICEILEYSDIPDWFIIAYAACAPFSILMNGLDQLKLETKVYNSSVMTWIEVGLKTRENLDNADLNNIINFVTVTSTVFECSNTALRFLPMEKIADIPVDTLSRLLNFEHIPYFFREDILWNKLFEILKILKEKTSEEDFKQYRNKLFPHFRQLIKLIENGFDDNNWVPLLIEKKKSANENVVKYYPLCEILDYPSIPIQFLTELAKEYPLDALVEGLDEKNSQKISLINRKEFINKLVERVVSENIIPSAVIKLFLLFNFEELSDELKNIFSKYPILFVSIFSQLSYEQAKDIPQASLSKIFELGLYEIKSIEKINIAADIVVIILTHFDDLKAEQLERWFLRLANLCKTLIPQDQPIAAFLIPDNFIQNAIKAKQFKESIFFLFYEFLFKCNDKNNFIDKNDMFNLKKEEVFKEYVEFYTKTSDPQKLFLLETIKPSSEMLSTKQELVKHYVDWLIKEKQFEVAIFYSSKYALKEEIYSTQALLKKQLEFYMGPVGQKIPSSVNQENRDKALAINDQITHEHYTNSAIHEAYVNWLLTNRGQAHDKFDYLNIIQYIEKNIDDGQREVLLVKVIKEWIEYVCLLIKVPINKESEEYKLAISLPKKSNCIEESAKAYLRGVLHQQLASYMGAYQEFVSALQLLKVEQNCFVQELIEYDIAELFFDKHLIYKLNNKEYVVVPSGEIINKAADNNNNSINSESVENAIFAYEYVRKRSLDQDKPQERNLMLIIYKKLLGVSQANSLSQTITSEEKLFAGMAPAVFEKFIEHYKNKGNKSIVNVAKIHQLENMVLDLQKELKESQAKSDQRVNALESLVNQLLMQMQQGQQANPTQVWSPTFIKK